MNAQNAITIDNEAPAGQAPAERREMPAARVALTPMDMLNRAVESGAGLDMVQKLMDLQDRWEASQARKAFDAAIAKAKAEIPVIARNATGHQNKRYADFSAYARVIDPILGKYGLSYRFRTSQTDKISVTCILSHEAGHFEENTLTGPADTTGSKNAIQAIGSTLTYLQRYSLTQALGLAAGDDDDGKAGGAADDKGPITEEQRDKLLALVSEVGADIEKLCAYFKIEALPDLPVSQYANAVAALEAKKQKVAKS